MTTVARVALGLALGALLASLPYLHYRATGGSHAHHAH